MALNDYNLGEKGAPTHQKNAIGVVVLLQIFHHMPVRGPLHHDLEGVECGTKTLQDIRMIQPHPQRNLPVEPLRNVNRQPVSAEGRGLTNLMILFHSHPLDAHNRLGVVITFWE